VVFMMGDKGIRDFDKANGTMVLPDRYIMLHMKGTKAAKPREFRGFTVKESILERDSLRRRLCVKAVRGNDFR